MLTSGRAAGIVGGMANKPLALDLFCGGGGACEGLMRAGFHVVGVDIVAKHGKNYPGEFIHGDALKPPVDLSQFDMIWASPPCQRFSVSTNGANRDKHQDLIPQTRNVLAGHPFTVIENVPPAPIRPDLILTGPMFGLDRIVRRRKFELSFFCLGPPPVYPASNKDLVTITTSMSSNNHFYRRKAQGLPGRLTAAEARDVMGISSPLTAQQVGLAIPPAYAEWIGRQIMQRLKRTAR